MNRIKIGLIVAVTMFSAVSCNPAPINPNYLATFDSVGDILRYEGNSNFDIVIDNYDTVRTLNTSHIKPEESGTGVRISFTAKIYETSGDPVLYKGDLTRISLVPVKEPLLLSEVKDDESLGEDIIELMQLTVSDKYLNTTYRIRQNDISVKHNISYVIDDVNASEQGVLNLKLRHNMNGDVPAQEAIYMMSCNIEKYIKAATSGELKINVYYDSAQEEDRVKTTTWKKDWWKKN